MERSYSFNGETAFFMPKKARALEKHNTIAEAASMVCGYFLVILLIIVNLQRGIMLALVIGDLLIPGFLAILFLPVMIKTPYLGRYLERYYVLNGKKAIFVRWTANFLLMSIASMSGKLFVDFL